MILSLPECRLHGCTPLGSRMGPGFWKFEIFRRPRFCSMCCLHNPVEYRCDLWLVCNSIGGQEDSVVLLTSISASILESETERFSCCDHFCWEGLKLKQFRRCLDRTMLQSLKELSEKMIFLRARGSTTLRGKLTRIGWVTPWSRLLYLLLRD